jgi:lipopolysaccharide transport system ATP-binding protein
MAAPAIEVGNLGKRYLLGQDTSRHRLALAMLPWLRQKKTHEFWALRNVSLTVQQGETVGIIGRNGAGKSTLLKVLSRITAPTEGWARVRGRVGTLLEVGTGFHPELSGRDNVFLSGTILGQSYRAVARKFDEIVEFAEVGEFIDTPVKRYSSGMYVRLAFAVALYLDPEILIVDEVLAVGDLGFQRKSVGRLNEAAIKDGRTVLFVSHSLETVKRFCRRVIVLDGGRMTFDGPPEDGIEFYRNSLPSRQENLIDVNLEDRLQRGTGAVRCSKFDVTSLQGEAKWSFRTGDSVRFRIKYEVLAAVSDLALKFRLYSHGEDFSGQGNSTVTCIYETISQGPLPAGSKGTAELVVPNLKLRPNDLSHYVCLSNVADTITYDVVDANVALPSLHITSESPNRFDREGIVSLDYEFKSFSADES